MLYRTTQSIPFLVLVSTVMLSTLQADQPKSGDRIVFLGDSITESGAQPGGYVALVAKGMKASLPDARIEIVGAGISGNKVPDLLARLDKDVLAKKPTAVFVYIGINDVWHSERGQGTPTESYASGLKELVSRIRADDARVILCTPSVIGERSDGGNPLDGLLDEYAEISRKVARDENIPLIDLRRAFISHLATANTSQKTEGILTTDGVHLNPAGNQFVADQILKHWGLAPATLGKLRHVVLFQFQETATSAEIQKVVDAFAMLPQRIDVVRGFESGLNVSVENRAQGFTHCFLLTFENERGRDEYLQHAAHAEFVAQILPLVKNVLVVDYWAR